MFKIVANDSLSKDQQPSSQGSKKNLAPAMLTHAPSPTDYKGQAAEHSMLQISAEYNNNAAAIEKEVRKPDCFKYQDSRSIIANQASPSQQTDQANDRLHQQIRTPGSARERLALNASGAGIDNNHAIDRSAMDVTASKHLNKNEFDTLRNGKSSKAGQNHVDQAVGYVMSKHQQTSVWQSNEHLKDYGVRAQFADEQHPTAQQETIPLNPKKQKKLISEKKKNRKQNKIQGEPAK